MSSAAEPPESGRGVVLLDVVRQRLVQVAAEVLGRLPADEVPASLRAVARFTPAKRHRLGAVPIAGVLDTDPRFRARVADAITEASRDLAEGLREGMDLPVSDPIDTAVVAYLLRPEGWETALAEASQRWLDERAPRDAAAEESARLRTEIAELKSRVRRLQNEQRQPTADDGALAEATSLAATLRKDLRIRTGELRTAQREREAAVADLAAVRAEFTAAAEANDAELRRLRIRMAELERAADSVRRSAKSDRDLDDARLRVLLDTLTEAAAGVRRELSLPASALRPADTVESSEDGRLTRRAADDPAALERLLTLPQVHLIVDGYNVTKTGYGDLPLADQRMRLTTSLAALHSRTPTEITVAFDGSARPPAQPRSPRGVRVLFSAEDELADDLIRRLVAAEPEGRPVVVVTSDQEVVRSVRGRGAWAAPAGVLLALLG